jgi:tetratricopeptide (TPR) repeat protein
MKIVDRRKRRPKINAKRHQGTAPGIWLMILFSAWTIVGAHAAFARATAVFQNAKREAVSGSGEEPDPQLKAVEADIAANNFVQTQSRINDYLKDHPDSARAYYDLGYVQFRTHEIGPSIKELSRSLELNPNDAEAHKVLALNCSIIGRYDLAEVELQQAARLKPESAEIHYFLARTYYTRGVYPLAKSEFETAIQLDPANIKAYSNLGITMEALGKTDAALKNYTTAVQLEDRQQQKSEWPYIYLSAYYNRQKNPGDALDYARKATEINSSSDSAYFEMAKAYRTQKQWPKAVEAAQSAIAVNPRMPDYYYVMGLALRELGNRQASEEALTKYGELQQHSDAAVLEHKAQEPLIAPESQ